MKTTKLFLFAIVFFAGGTLFGASFIRQNIPDSPLSSPAATAEKAVSVMIDYGGGTLTTFTDIQFGDGETLFELLAKKLSAESITFEYRDYKELGKLITRIGDKENGDGKQYWQYWVNNRHAEVGADAYALRPGDVIEWKFLKSQGN